MKLTSILLFAACFQLSAAGYSQTISLSEKNATIETIFGKIKEQSGYLFWYKLDLLKKTSKVNINIKNASIEQALNQVLKNQPLTFEIIDKTIVVKSKSEAGTIEKAIDISGTVKDEKGLPLPGASVKVKGSTVATSTNVNGEFRLRGISDDAVLVVSYLGFTTREIAVEGRTVIDVKLAEELKDMSEVVVVGYGTIKKSDVTGSIGQVKMSDIQKAPIISFEEALAGRVAGVKVSSADGQPGADINVVIRGTNSVTQDNSPLYVIDGFPIEGADNYALNPAEIESIEVLKDASATAIYGARGANGVIMVTTKKGKAGDPVVNFNTYFGSMQNKRKMELFNGYDFVKYQIERDSVNANATYLINGKTLETFRNEESIDLQDEIFHNSPFQNNYVSVSGGKGGTLYSISGSMLHQDGLIKNSGYNRYQGRVNINQTVNSKLKVGLNTNYSSTNKFGITPSAQETGFFYGNLMYSVWAYRPVSGKLVIDPLDDQDDDFLSLQGFNPIRTVENELRRTTADLLTSNAYGEYAFGKYLKLRVTGGLTKTKSKRDVFNNSQTRSGSPLTTTGKNLGVNGSVTYNESNSFLNENTLTFNKVYNKFHTVNILSGFTLQKTTFSVYGAGANQIPNEALGLAGIDEGQPVSINSSNSIYTLASFLGRVNYSYRSKYLLTGSLRADGSSKFAPENRWSYFPSGAIAWKINQEDFMKPLRFISDAKIRASYGATGNNRVQDFAYLSRISLPSNIGYSYNNTPVKAAILSELGNVNLKWETTRQADAGLDLGFFNQRITFTADVYRKTTSDLLLNAKVPISLGFVDAVKNIGKVQNQGLELTLNTVNLKNSSFSWNSNFNISFNRNKVLALAENQSTLFTVTNWNIDLRSVPLYIAEVNQPIARFYGYIWEGNYQYDDFDETAPGVYTLKSTEASYNANRALTQPGDIKYKDINSDGVVNSDDRTIIGNPNPKFTGGFSNDLTYKNFDLNLFFEFSVGNEVMNANRIIFEGGGRVNQNMYSTYLNRWTPENQNNDYYRTNGRGPANFGYSTRVVEDASYLRLKTLSLGYNIPSKVIDRLKLKTFRVYTSAQNVLTFTKYQGFDPEVSAFGSSALQPGFDYSVYPRARVITFGANISF